MGSMSIAFSPDGSLLAAGFRGSPHSPLYLFWDITRDSHEGNAFGFFSIDGATSVAVNADNSRLASGSCNDIHLWDISTREKILQLDSNSRPLATLERHSACVEQLSYNPDSSLLISAADNEIFVWDTGDDSVVRTLAGRSFALNASGTQMAIICQGVVQLWSLPD